MAKYGCTRTEKKPLICGIHYWFSANSGLLPSLNCSIYTKNNENGDRKQITSPAEHTVLCTNNTSGIVECVSVVSDMTHCGS